VQTLALTIDREVGLLLLRGYGFLFVVVHCEAVWILLLQLRRVSHREILDGLHVLVCICGFIDVAFGIGCFIKVLEAKVRLGLVDDFNGRLVSVVYLQAEDAGVEASVANLAIVLPFAYGDGYLLVICFEALAHGEDDLGSHSVQEDVFRLLIEGFDVSVVVFVGSPFKDLPADFSPLMLSVSPQGKRYVFLLFHHFDLFRKIINKLSEL